MYSKVPSQHNFAAKVYGGMNEYGTDRIIYSASLQEIMDAHHHDRADYTDDDCNGPTDRMKSLGNHQETGQ